MTIKSSGSPLKFSDISKEFGTPTGNKLGNYRVNQEVGDADFRLDEGMPIGNQSIKFSDFFSSFIITETIKLQKYRFFLAIQLQNKHTNYYI